MLAQGSGKTDNFNLRRLSRANSKLNALSDSDNTGEPDCKRIKLEDGVEINTKSEDSSHNILSGNGESVPDGTGSWGDVSYVLSTLVKY